MSKKINIVGIAGVGRSGKDSLAELFIKDGYFGVSFGDIIRDLTQERHASDPHPISRANMTDTSNWLRETRGPDVIMKIALERYEEAQKTKDYQGLMAWSIRAPIEADFILSHKGKLIWIDVSDDVRYKRAMNGLREGEPHLSFDEFMAQENTQFKPLAGIPKEIQMDLPYVKSKATIIIENNFSELKDFYAVSENLNDQYKF
jgi:dephospho-CoA kinase